MSRGKKIASGWEAEVYEWSEGDSAKVLKLFFEADSLSAQNEQQAMRALHASGIPVPVVFGVVLQEAGRTGLIMERIPGRNMDSIIAAHPFDRKLLATLGHQLGELHAEIHRVRGVHLQRSYKDFIAGKVETADQLSKTERDEVLRLLHRLPDGNQICHGDLHFGNVMSGDVKPVAIDWVNACKGDAMADVARTQLLLSTSWIAASLLDTVLAVIVRRLKSYLGLCYTEGYFAASEADPALVEQWRTVIAAARLTEGLPKRQESVVTGIVRKSLARH